MAVWYSAPALPSVEPPERLGTKIIGLMDTQQQRRTWVTFTRLTTTMVIGTALVLILLAWALL